MSTHAAQLSTELKGHTNPGCLGRVQRAFGRLWEWIVDCWHWCTHKIFRTVDTFAFGFFRVAEWFSPTLAMRMEAGYGYLSSFYARYAAAIHEEKWKTQVAGLEEINKHLNQQIQQVVTQSTKHQLTKTQLEDERNRLKAERNQDIRAKQAAIVQTDLAKTAHRIIAERNSFLQQENSSLQTQLQESIAKRAPILNERDRLIDQNKNLQTSNALLQTQLRHAQDQKLLVLESLMTVGTINNLLGIPDNVSTKKRLQ